MTTRVPYAFASLVLGFVALVSIVSARGGMDPAPLTAGACYVVVMGTGLACALGSVCCALRALVGDR